MNQNALPGRGWLLAVLAAVTLLVFAGGSSLVAPTTASAIPPAPPAYYPFGPQVDVEEAIITGGGWTLCYSGNYNDPLSIGGIPVGRVRRGLSVARWPARR